MHHPPSAACLIAATLALGAAGCQDEPFEGELIWEGDFVRLFKEKGTDIEVEDWCPGTLTHLDRFTPFIMDQMAVEDRSPIDYAVLESQPEAYFPGCEGGAGCALDSKVFSKYVPHDH
jgi:hypothetical protein